MAQILINEIQNGRYPVGDLMPTEMELCAQFGASRFTVRVAIKQLVELGLVNRQAGVGTKVYRAALELSPGHARHFRSPARLARGDFSGRI